MFTTMRHASYKPNMACSMQYAVCSMYALPMRLSSQTQPRPVMHTLCGRLCCYCCYCRLTGLLILAGLI